jgi:chemotaxis response regulator CheB
VLTQDQNNDRVNLKVMVVADSATMRKVIRNYLQQRGLENFVLAADDILPQAIFWLKK